MTRTCTRPGCTRPAHARHLCKTHYGVETYEGSQGRWISTPIALFPRYTRRQADALEQLAQTPNLTPERYEAEKARILQGLP